MALQIIVCDDEPHIVRAISLKLTRAGFDVKGVADTESCWKLLHRNACPAMLIVDNSQPASDDSLELVRRIRNDRLLAGLSIVLLTANGIPFEDERELMTDLEVSQIVSKPFSPRELLVLVSRILHQHAETIDGEYLPVAIKSA